MPPVFGYRPTKSRHILRSGYPVCTVIAFNPAGNLRPVAFGVEMEGMRYRYKINDAKIVKDKNGIFAFDCDYVELGRLKTVRLVFDINNHLWSVG